MTETTHYIGGLYERIVRPASLTEHKHFILAGGEAVAMHIRRSTSVHETVYLHKDHLGSVDTVTNGSGGVVVRLSYDAFGKRRDDDWVGAPDAAEMTAVGNSTRRGYTFHEHLDNLSLIHMNGRVYDPGIGRFISADPFVQAPFNLQSLNRYSYVFNNPLSYTDPSGFREEFINCIEGCIAVAGGLMTYGQRGGDPYYQQPYTGADRPRPRNANPPPPPSPPEAPDLGAPTSWAPTAAPSSRGSEVNLTLLGHGSLSAILGSLGAEFQFGAAITIGESPDVALFITIGRPTDDLINYAFSRNRGAIAAEALVGLFDGSTEDYRSESLTALSINTPYVGYEELFTPDLERTRGFAVGVSRGVGLAVTEQTTYLLGVRDIFMGIYELADRLRDWWNSD